MEKVFTRRSALTSASALAWATILNRRAAAAANASHVRFGASRWDAWYDNTPRSDEWYAQQNLNPTQYQLRAPFFARKLSSGSMLIDGDQADMDAEITFATSGGLKYWAFLSYSPAGGDAAFNKGWALYQSSRLKHHINWCWIYNYAALADAAQDDYKMLISQLRQNNYETVLGYRPLVYLQVNGDDQHASHYTNHITALHAACVRAQIGAPYIAFMGKFEDMQTLHADAVTNYSWAFPTNRGTYKSLVKYVEAYWPRRAAQAPIIPICMTGWDRRPRIEHPVPWEAKYQKPNQGINNSFQTASAMELASHLQDCIEWIGVNPKLAPANTAIIYSWNEFDEGGWLCPTWTANGPDHSRLDALAPVIS